MTTTCVVLVHVKVLHPWSHVNLYKDRAIFFKINFDIHAKKFRTGDTRYTTVLQTPYAELLSLDG